VRVAPACAKHQTKASSYAKATKDTSKGTTKTTQKEEINTMIEVDNDIFEIEEEIETKKSIRKF